MRIGMTILIRDRISLRNRSNNINSNVLFFDPSRQIECPRSLSDIGDRNKESWFEEDFLTGCRNNEEKGGALALDETVREIYPKPAFQQSIVPKFDRLVDKGMGKWPVLNHHSRNHWLRVGL